METVKTRLVDSGKGLVDGVRYVVSKHGVGGLYKGLLPTMSKSCSNRIYPTKMLHLVFEIFCNP